MYIYSRYVPKCLMVTANKHHWPSSRRKVFAEDTRHTHTHTTLQDDRQRCEVKHFASRDKNQYLHKEVTRYISKYVRV